MYPLSLGFGSGWHLVRLLVRLTFGPMYPHQRDLVAKCVNTLVRLTSGQMYPQQWHLVAKCATTLVRLTPLVRHTPSTDILWPSVLLLWSDWPLVRHTQAQTSCGQMCYYFGQADLWSDAPPMIRLQVRLTFSQAFGQADLWSDVPPPETSCGQVCYYFSQVDLWSDIPPSHDILWSSVLLFWLDWPLVRHTPSTDILWPSVLLLWWSWPLVRHPQQRHHVAKCATIQVRLTFSQTFGQADLWSDVPPTRDILWPGVLLLQSGWPLVRCTP